MNETLGLMGLVVVSLLMLGTLSLYFAESNVSTNQEFENSQRLVNGAQEYAQVVGDGVNLGVYYPNTPGLEASGGKVLYTQSNPSVESYRYPVTSTVYYSYKVPENSQDTWSYNLPSTQTVDYSYTYYTSSLAQVSYSVPSTALVAYDRADYLTASGSEQYTSYEYCARCTYYPDGVTESVPATRTVYYPYTIYKQGSERSAYTTPGGETSVSASYTVYTYGSTPSVYYTMSSAPFTWTYTTYSSTATPCSYTVPVNSQVSGNYYANETVITDGKYQVELVPYSYTYYATSWANRTTTCYADVGTNHAATYYVDTQVAHDYTFEQPVATAHSYIYSETLWASHSFTDYWGIPVTGTGSYTESYWTSVHLGAGSYSSTIVTAVWYYGERVADAGSYEETAWASETGSAYQIASHTVEDDYLDTSYTQASQQYTATSWNGHTGSYLSTSWTNATAEVYNTSPSMQRYTYTNATLTNLGAHAMIVTAVVYAGPQGLYVVPLNSAPPSGTAGWLSENRWNPSPGAWTGWAGWGTGTGFSRGFAGYDWGGFPFVTDGAFSPDSAVGVTLLSGENLTVPYVPGYECGFVSSSGDVWWVA